MSKTAMNNSPKDWIWLGGILLLTLITLWTVKDCDFLSNWDDTGYVIQNTHIYELSWANVKNWFTSFYKSNYQPLSVATYAIEFALFKLKPAPYHITNLLFHLINTGLVFFFIKKLVNRLDVAVIVAVLFGIHPMHLESVVWISERKDVMYGLFFIWGMIVYLDYLRKGLPQKTYWILLLIYLGSLLSKPMAVTFPLILLALDYYEGRRFTLKVFIEKIPFFILSIIFGLVALKSQSGSAMDIVPDFSIVDRIFIACYGVVFYFFKLIIPTGLASIHYYPDNNKALPWMFYSAPIVISMIVFVVWKAKEFRRELVFGLAFFILSISIVLQLLFPVGYAFASERYSYIPYLGLFFIMGQFYAWIQEDKFSFSKTVKPVMLPLFGIGIIAFSVLTYQRIEVWQNSLKLYTDLTQKYPEAPHGHWMLGNVKKDYKMYPESIVDYDKAILLDSTYAKAYFNRGGSKASLGKQQEALKDYTLAIINDSLYEPAWNNRGNSYLNLKKYDLAIADYEECNRLNNDYAIGFLGAGNAYLQIKNYPKAIEKYSRALAISPTYSEVLHNRGVAFYYDNKKDQACADWKKAVALGYKASEAVVNSYCK